MDLILSGADLRGLIASDPDLSARLGTYALPAGGIVPALSVGWAYPPPGTVAAGLEIAIGPLSEMPALPRAGDATRFAFRSDIVLKQWDGTRGTAEAAASLVRLLRQWGTVEVKRAVFPEQNLGNIETRRLTFEQAAVVKYKR